MAIIKTAPHGDWKSAISAEAATAGNRSLTSPRVCPKTGRGFFVESRANGTNSIVEATADGPKHVLPEDFSVSTVVYEYGGLAYTPIPGDRLRIIFSDSNRNSLNVLDVDEGTVEPLVESATLRYADFDCHPEIADGTEEHAWVLAIEEDHTNPKPEDVMNYVIAINLATKEVKRVVEGADFYSYPRFSPDRQQVAWLQWNHPNLPFRGVQLYLAEFISVDASLSETRLVAGGDGDSIAEPRWSLDGQLFFGSDKTGFRQLNRLRDGVRECIDLPGLEDAELGDAHWMVGCQSYVFLTEDTMIAAPVRFGEYQLVCIDLKTQGWTKLDIPLAELLMDCLAPVSETSFLVIGSGLTTPRGVYLVEILPDLRTTATLLRSSINTPLSTALFSSPQHIHFTTLKEPRREVHGFFWPPHNPRYVAPEGALPPLIVKPHGGPTYHTPPGLDMQMQYYTSRGYAYFAINYSGASAHGKAYREGLFGNWGILDRDDVAEAVEYLAWSGRVDRNRVGIEGGSAGGYNVLCSLTWHPDIFAGGICYCGVSDAKALKGGMHKMESHYVDVLLGLEGKLEGEKEVLFWDRSPLHHAENIAAPLLLVHGNADPVVPIAQSKEIKRRIEGKGGEVQLIELEGEGHMFSRAESWLTILVEGEKWWRRTLLKVED